MLVGQVTGYSKGYLGVRTSAGKNLSVHVVKTTLAHRGPKPISPASIKAGTRVNISTQARGGYYKANFIYALASGGGNPCGANPCGGNPCAKNPCAGNPCAKTAKNPCGGNPCAAKNPCGANPCAKKNPCGANPVRKTLAQTRVPVWWVREKPVRRQESLREEPVCGEESVRQESLRSEALTTPPRVVRGV